MVITKSFPTPDYELVPTIPVAKYVSRELFCRRSPFLPPSRLRNLLVSISISFFKLLNWTFGVSFLVEDHDRELSVFDRPSRRLLVKLLNSKQVISWECWRNNSVVPHWICTLTIGEIRHPASGNLLVEAGRLKAHGAASEVTQALNIAMAEALERRAGSQWDESVFHKASIRHMEENRRSYLAKAYVRDLSEAERNIPINWSKCNSLLDNKRTYLPASALYIFYNLHHPSEPVFVDPTSNAMAAHTTLDKAVAHAFFEAVERDGFLIYWMNKLSPQRIDFNTIPDQRLQQIISNLDSEGIRLELLDCRTEVGIPTVVSVAIHSRTGRISVNAAAGFVFDEILEKVVVDTLRWDTNYYPEKPQVNFSEIRDLREREKLWYGGHMKDYIDFFVSGSLISYEDYIAQFDLTSKTGSNMEKIKKSLVDLQWEAYYYRLTNKAAKEAGLEVVRTIVPELIPIYFNESNKHVNLDRIKRFPKLMGYANADTVELNHIPHPFI